jgi:hypothetical protein
LIGRTSTLAEATIKASHASSVFFVSFCPIGNQLWTKGNKDNEEPKMSFNRRLAAQGNSEVRSMHLAAPTATDDALGRGEGAPLCASLVLACIAAGAHVRRRRATMPTPITTAVAA